MVLHSLWDSVNVSVEDTFLIDNIEMYVVKLVLQNVLLIPEAVHDVLAFNCISGPADYRNKKSVGSTSECDHNLMVRLECLSKPSAQLMDSIQKNDQWSVFSRAEDIPGPVLHR